MHITTCHITLHENLFYASREMGRLYETERFLHNYGLTYALGSTLGLSRPYFNPSQVPGYTADLKPLATRGIYVTPARPLEYGFAFNTFKLGEPAYYSFTPQIVANRVVYGRAKELVTGSRFEFFLLSRESVKLPRWIRLGKWMSKAELEVHSAGDYEPRVPSEEVVLSCPLNPLDYPPGSLISFDIVNMPPVSLLTNAITREACYDTGSSGNHVYIPAGLSFFGAEQ